MSKKRNSKKKYVCKECGHILSTELSELLEKKVQVYCEKCGTPFELEGIKLKERNFNKKEEEKQPKYQHEREIKPLSEDQKKGFIKLIQILNKISFFPLFIVSILILIGITDIIEFNLWISTLPERIFLGTSGILISLYDIKYISPQIKANNFEKVVLDAFCWGILGSIILGSGSLILIKGIFVFLYALFYPEDPQRKLFDFGLYMKDSFNNFSAMGGVIIILLRFSALFSGLALDFPLAPLITFLALSSVALTIDYIYYRKELKEKWNYDIFDSIGLLIIGILGVLFFAAGIFIMLKSILIFFLIFGEPSQSYLNRVQKGEKKKKGKQKKQKPTPGQRKENKREKKIYKDRKKKIQSAKVQRRVSELKSEEKDLKKARKEKEKELELRLHDSLLPVKDKEDKKVVKKYFSKIFTILSRDIREQIYELDIPREEKRDLLKELAFLSKEKQVRYMKEIVNLYKEDIPEKLVMKIRNLPNLKEKHYQKIVNKLKTMNPEEQIEYVQFLEKHAI
ncbi:MAG: hypothetical protein R6U96_11060 [Promethearchaeia archaeon]